MVKKFQYDVYGIKRKSLEEVKVKLENIVCKNMETRESGYYGGEYYKCRIGEIGEVMVHNNFDTFTKRWIRESYKEYSIIVMVSELDNMAEIQRELLGVYPECVLLERRTIEE